MMKIQVLVTLFALFVFIPPSLSLSNYAGEDDALEKWHKINDMLKEGMKKLTKSVLPFTMRLTSGLNLSASCVRDGLHVFNGIRKLDPMATRFIDSSGKMIDGIAVGTLSAVGAYDECLDTEVFSNDKDGKANLLYKGQYCTLELRPPLPKENKVFKSNEVMEGFQNFTKSNSIISEFAKTAQMFYFLSLRFGICVPSGCTKDDINQIANAIGSSIYINANVTRCEVKEPNKYYPSTITAMFIYSLTVFLVLIGSLLDINRKRFSGNGKLLRCLLKFSLFKSYAKLIKVGDQSENLRCLNGIRFFTLCWITLTHTYSLLNYYNLKYTLRAVDYIQDFAFQFVVNAFHISDTFFVIGGAVSCYVVITHVKTKGSPFNIPMYIINRLARILPVYIYLILFFFLLNLFGSGPFWKDFASSEVQKCDENWWTNLLFINNFLDAESTCAHHTWYLACDFQFYLAAILILLPLLKQPKVGIALNVLVITSSAISCGFVTYFYDYPPTAILNSPNFLKTREYFNFYFFRPYPHIGPYFVGLLLGYVLAVKPNVKISRRIQLLCWVLAFVSSFSIIYGSVGWNRGREPTVIETLFYASFSKIAWALSVAWLIFACATGYGGFINRFLSWEGFVPLGRLSFMAYLVHPIVILLHMSALQTRQQASHFYLVWQFFGHLCVTFIFSFAASMIIEAPFISLTKMMFARENETGSGDTSEKVKVYPVQSLHFYSDVKPGIDEGSITNHKTDKVHQGEPISNDVVANGGGIEGKEKRIKLSELIAQNNFHNDMRSFEKHELEVVKVEDSKTSDEVDLNGSVTEIIGKHEYSEEAKKESYTHLNGINEVVKESHVQVNGINKPEENSTIHYNGINEVGNVSHIYLNGMKKAKNSNEILETEKNAEQFDVDVKATYCPGLGWKLG